MSPNQQEAARGNQHPKSNQCWGDLQNPNSLRTVAAVLMGYFGLFLQPTEFDLEIQVPVAQSRNSNFLLELHQKNTSRHRLRSRNYLLGSCLTRLLTLITCWSLNVQRASCSTLAPNRLLTRRLGSCSLASVREWCRLQSCSRILRIRSRRSSL